MSPFIQRKEISPGEGLTRLSHSGSPDEADSTSPAPCQTPGPSDGDRASPHPTAVPSNLPRPHRRPGPRMEVPGRWREIPAAFPALSLPPSLKPQAAHPPPTTPSRRAGAPRSLEGEGRARGWACPAVRQNSGVGPLAGRRPLPSTFGAALPLSPGFQAFR